LIGACSRNGVDPQAYLASVLSRLVNGWHMCKIDELMPGLAAPAKTLPLRAENTAHNLNLVILSA
jgi:hypothetical protein